MYISMGLPGPFRVGTRIGRTRAEREAARRRRADRKHARRVRRAWRRQQRRLRAARVNVRMGRYTTPMPHWVWWVWAVATLALAVVPATLFVTGFAGLLIAQYAMCRAAGTGNAAEAAMILWSRRLTGAATTDTLPSDPDELERMAAQFDADGMPQSAQAYRTLARDARATRVA